MQILSAIHIAYFGVFPDRDVDPEVTESLRGINAHIMCEQIAASTQNTSGFPDLGSEEAFKRIEKAQEEQETINKAALAAMHSAYELAAHEKWIRPLMGTVFVVPPMHHDPDLSYAEQLESNAIAIFHAHAKQSVIPSFIHNAADIDAVPAAVMAHIRVVVNGKIAAFAPDDKTYLFKSAVPGYGEPTLNIADFDLNAVDTVAYLSRHPAYRFSTLMGYAGPPRTPSGPQSAP